MNPTFSLVINHTPWRPERVRMLARMMNQLNGAWGAKLVDAFWLHDTDYRNKGTADSEVPGNPKPRNVDFTIAQWRWAVNAKSPAGTEPSHHLFMTDDLVFMRHFWSALEAMVSAKPDACIGLMSNHPRVAELDTQRGEHWYRCNSWIVGPCYVVPHAHMVACLAWAEQHGCMGQGWSDDSTLNEWITRHGPGESWHPVPTIVKHTREVESTWAHTGHGDAYSHERITWEDTPWFAPEDLTHRGFWEGEGPMWVLP